MKLEKEDNQNGCQNWEKIKSAFEILKKKIDSKGMEIFIFSSFDWFDYLVLVTINLYDDTLDLRGILEVLKKEVIFNNNQLKLIRTETSIFVGRSILSKVKIPSLNILLRISSDNFQEGKALIEICESLLHNKGIKKFKISSYFGIRDLVVQLEENLTCETLMRITSQLHQEAKSKGIKISDIQLEPLLTWGSKIRSNY